MFFPVVFVLLLCNIEPIVHYGLIRSEVIYRELQMLMYASFACNSAVNLPIYCYRSAGFRRDAVKLLGRWQGKMCGKFCQSDELAV